MSGKPVKTVEDFRRALTTLLRDLGQANNHYELCKKLYAASVDTQNRPLMDT